MAHHIRARDVVGLHDPVKQRHQRLDLRVREGAVAVGVAGMIQFDADTGGIHVAYSAPVAQARVPGAPALLHESDDLATFRDEVVRADLGLRVAHAGEGRIGTQHVRVVEHHHGHGQGPLVEIGRGDGAMNQFFLSPARRKGAIRHRAGPRP